ncbi:MAG TPA: hypothetical protein VGM32_24525 [Rhodopila sp.]|jgi:hypothetical protein
MSASRVFSGVTIELVERIKQVARDEHGVRFDPDDGPTGLATGQTPFGECVVRFAHRGAQAAIVLTLLKKPMLLPAEVLWTAFKEEIDRCRGLI